MYINEVKTYSKWYIPTEGMGYYSLFKSCFSHRDLHTPSSTSSRP